MTNIVVLTGRLGADPEVKATSGGNSVCGFSIAVDDGYGDKKKTDWWYIEVWGKTAEAVAKFTQKGNRVTVTGKLKQDVWESNGEKKYKTKVVATSVDIIDFAKEPDGTPF